MTVFTGQVREAVGMEWLAFAARHEDLAGVVDREALVARAAARLAAEPECRRALAEAAAAGMGGHAVEQMLRAFVRDWLARMLS